MKKTIALILTAVLAVTLFGISAGAADDYEHVIFINRDGILFNGNVGTLTPGSGYDEVDVEEYLGGTIEISGWCVTDVEIQQYGYTVDGGEFIPSDYVNNVAADANAIRAQMAKFEDAVDAARFWVVVPTQPGDHTIEVYLKTDDVMIFGAKRFNEKDNIKLTELAIKEEHNWVGLPIKKLDISRQRQMENHSFIQIKGMLRNIFRVTGAIRSF